MSAGSIWSSGDPNTAADGDLCESVTIKNVCADGVSTCSTRSECTACDADGSAVIFSLADPDATVEYLEIENFDAWLQDAVSPDTRDCCVCLRLRSITRKLRVNQLCCSDQFDLNRFGFSVQGGCDGAPAGGAYFRTACATWSNARAECQAYGGTLDYFLEFDFSHYLASRHASLFPDLSFPLCLTLY